MLRLGSKGRRIYEITKTIRLKDGINDRFEFVQKQNLTLYTQFQRFNRKKNWTRDGNVKRFRRSASIRSEHPKFSDSRITIKTGGKQCYSKRSRREVIIDFEKCIYTRNGNGRNYCEQCTNQQTAQNRKLWFTQKVPQT